MFQTSELVSESMSVSQIDRHTHFMNQGEFKGKRASSLSESLKWPKFELKFFFLKNS